MLFINNILSLKQNESIVRDHDLITYALRFLITEHSYHITNKRMSMTKITHKNLTNEGVSQKK